ncbi:MAG: hypothetical protein DRQ54_10665 [Gammaproteobacteria bacterium]|nr:MAG: hypothetical protein DRQ54_10665 [Gammaproteobacteria bacterium]
MDNALSKLEKIRDEHDLFGKKLIALSNGKIFPCDALYLSVLNRSLELFDGFLLLAKNGKYGCCMAMLRMQLDNVLRFYGVLLTEDPHETSNNIFKGTPLYKIKDKKGKQLKDYYLVECLSENNDWISRVYKLCSSYVHLSDQHIFHMLGRTEDAGNGERNFYIGSSDEHVEEKHRIELVNAFAVVTKGIFKFFPEWEKLSKEYDLNQLEARYKVYE